MNCSTYSSITLSDAADLAQVVIAIFNLLLAIYILFYQRAKDRESSEIEAIRDQKQRAKDLRAENSTALLNEQNIKLQWFKELIVQPNISTIENFYNQLSTIKAKISSNDLTTEEKESINDFVKSELAIFRKSFIDVLMQVDQKFAIESLQNLDSLVNGITDSIFDEELKLMLSNVYEKHIGSKISYSRNSLIAQLYNYKGLPPSQDS